MILEYISILTIVSIPLFVLSGWETITLKDDIYRLKLSGPFDHALISFKEFYSKDWNSSLINLYVFRLKIVRILQAFVLFLATIYLYTGYLTTNFCILNKITIKDIALSNPPNQPTQVKVFFGCLACIWVIGIFLRVTTVAVIKSKSTITNEISDTRATENAA